MAPVACLHAALPGSLASLCLYSAVCVRLNFLFYLSVTFHQSNMETAEQRFMKAFTLVVAAARRSIFGSCGRARQSIAVQRQAHSFEPLISGYAIALDGEPGWNHLARLLS